MIRKNNFFHQPILYKGIRLSCKSLFGYDYKIKTPEDQCYGFYDFVTEFLHKLNVSIEKEYDVLMLTDTLGLFFEIPLLILLLILTFSFHNNLAVRVALTIIIVFSTIAFVTVKFRGTQNLHKKINEFVTQNKPVLDDVGLYVSVFKARCFDTAPEVFLNLLPSTLHLEMEDKVNTPVNKSKEAEEKEQDHEGSKLVNDERPNNEAPIHLDIKSPDYSVDRSQDSQHSDH